MRSVWLYPWILLISGAAQSAPPVPCVVVRKPTAQQRQQSAADVERLLDDYESKTRDNEAWPAALAEVFERFPLPSVNMLVALHHPAWAARERKLLAFVEATRQDPNDYAEPEAVAQTIQRIQQSLLPDLQQGPPLILEARGVVRRQQVQELDVHVDGLACLGEPIPGGASRTVSWNFGTNRLTATVAPQSLSNGQGWCIAIERDSIGPCDGDLGPFASPTLGAKEPTHSAPQPTKMAKAPAAPANRRVETSTRPLAIDYRLALPGLALAATGFGMAGLARHQIGVHLDRAERGDTPPCSSKHCSASGIAEVLAARNWTTAYYVAGGAGLLGLGAVIASGHRYYASWLFPSAARGSLQVLPVTARAGAGLLLCGDF